MVDFFCNQSSNYLDIRHGNDDCNFILICCVVLIDRFTSLFVNRDQIHKKSM